MTKCIYSGHTKKSALPEVPAALELSLKTAGADHALVKPQRSPTPIMPHGALKAPCVSALFPKLIVIHC